MVRAGILAIAVLAGAAPASEASVDLQWDGTAACPDSALAQEKLQAYLVHADDVSAEGVVARVVVSETEAGLQATLELTTAWGESRRTLQAERCEDIADAVALVIATTIDPLLGIRDPHDAGPASEPSPRTPEVVPPEPEPEPEPLPPPDPTVRAEPTTTQARAPGPAETRAPPERSPIVVLGAIGAGVGAGLRLRAGAVLDGSVGVQWRWLRVLALGSYAFAGERPLAGTPDGSITLQSWSAGALACGVPRLGRFELPACAGIEGGTMIGSSQGVADTGSASRPWLGAAARVGLHLRVTRRVALALDVHGIGVGLRPTFHVDKLGTVYTAPSVAGRALLGVQVRWP